MWTGSLCQIRSNKVPNACSVREIAGNIQHKRCPFNTNKQTTNITTKKPNTRIGNKIAFSSSRFSSAGGGCCIWDTGLCFTQSCSNPSGTCWSYAGYCTFWTSRSHTPRVFSIVDGRLEDRKVLKIWRHDRSLLQLGGTRVSLEPLLQSGGTRVSMEPCGNLCSWDTCISCSASPYFMQHSLAFFISGKVTDFILFLSVTPALPLWQQSTGAGGGDIWQEALSESVNFLSPKNGSDLSYRP